MWSKDSWHKGHGFSLPPGRGFSMTLLCSIYIWSVGVLEYWSIGKTKLNSDLL
jgi:hypothetical protein